MSITPRYRTLLSGFVALLGIAFFTAESSAQAATFRGKVTAEKNGEAIIGATVIIGELQLSVLTNATGNYVLTVPAARVSGQTVTLSARAIGYKSVARVVGSLTAGERTVDFPLAQDINKLEEIIVTGVLEGTERAKVPYMLVAGDREVQTGTLSVRTRGGATLGTMTVEAVLDHLKDDVARRGAVTPPQSPKPD